MAELDLISLFVNPLERLGVDYFITGSVAAMLFGEPRTTLDIDLVLNLTTETLPLLVRAFPSPHYYCPPLEVVRLEVQRFNRGHANIIHMGTGTKADLYFSGAEPLHAWALSRRRRIGDGASGIWAAPPEYIILRKLEYYQEGGSDKHLRDIAAMRKIIGSQLDLSTLMGWIAERGLTGTWQKTVPSG